MGRKIKELASARPIRLDWDGHAIARWIERWQPDASPKEAEAELLRLIKTAELSEIDQSNNVAIFKLTNAALIVVDIEGTVRTVLPRDAQKPQRRPIK